MTGSLLVTVIVVSYKLKMDPDNIGSPVAASMGDVICLSLFAFYANQMFKSTPPHDPSETFYSFPVIPVAIIVTLLCLLPLWFVIAWKNEYTRPSVPSGWIPIFIAVMLSTCSGFILDYATYDFVRYAVFQPVINGIGGNLVAVHSSRMSTALHKTSSLGDLPEGVKQFRSPFRAFFDKKGGKPTAFFCELTPLTKTLEQMRSWRTIIERLF
jgi:solute carrier family 41